MRGAIRPPEVREPRGPDRRQNGRRVGGAFIDLVGLAVEASLVRRLHRPQKQGVDVVVDVQDDEKRAERQRAALQFAPEVALEGRPGRADVPARQGEPDRDGEGRAATKATPRPTSPAPPSEPPPPPSDEDHAVGDDDEALVAEPLEADEDPTDRHQIRPQHRADQHQQAGDAKVRRVPRDKCHRAQDDEHRQTGQHLQSEGVLKDSPGAVTLARDRPNRDLMDTEVQERFADGGQAQGAQLKAPKTSVPRVADDENDDDQQQAGAAGGQRGIDNVLRLDAAGKPCSCRQTIENRGELVQHDGLVETQAPVSRLARRSIARRSAGSR